MIFPEPFVAPVAPDCVTVQAKLAPVTPDVKVILVVAPLQIACDDGVAITFGVGFTVTGTITDVPKQEFADGVIV